MEVEGGKEEREREEDRKGEEWGAERNLSLG